LDDYRAQAEARIRGRLPDYLGMQVHEVTPRGAVLSMTFAHHLTMPYGVMHGGAIAALADTAAGLPVFAGLKEGETFTTAEMKLNLIRPVREGTITAVSEVVHRGRRTAVCQTRVTNEEGALVALFICTQVILRDDPPRG